MRIVHTSDWHAGRVWKGIRRLDELGQVLEHLGDFLEKEEIDLLLMSGDVFDSGAPNPEAEKLVFSFFKRTGQAGIPSVVIAGNHDSPTRLQAWGMLAELVDAHTVGVPRRAEQGGILDFTTKSGERARVAAVPFAPVHRLVSAMELAGEETPVRQKYDDMMRAIVRHLSDYFSAETVNLMTAHTHLQGAAFSGSEREVHLGEQWATTAQALPSSAHYVGLGHIHRPQRVTAAPSPTYYAGSPLQLDFGEQGEEKSFVVIEARPRSPARVERVAYEGGTELETITAGLERLERDAEELSHSGYLRVKVPLPTPDPDINSKVRRLLPNAVVVEVELPQGPEEKDETRPPRGAPPRELYRAYLLNRHGNEPEPDLLEAFDRLHEGSEPA
jgi:exonuclease SbcD